MPRNAEREKDFIPPRFAGEHGFSAFRGKVIFSSPRFAASASSLPLLCALRALCADEGIGLNAKAPVISCPGGIGLNANAPVMSCPEALGLAEQDAAGCVFD